MSRRILRRASVLHLDPLRIEAADVLIEDGQIAAIGLGIPTEDAIEEKHPGALILPGLVCAHTHLATSLLPGAPRPADAAAQTGPRSPLGLRYDEALDPYAIWIATLIGGLDALRCGVTTLIDQHSSPRSVKGSLEAIDGALDLIGQRRVLSYEVSERQGHDGVRAALKAHEVLLSAAQNPRRALMIVLDATQPPSARTLSQVAQLSRDAGVGVHVHVAEGRFVDDALPPNLLGDLGRHGLLRPGTLLAHGAWLDRKALRTASEQGAWTTVHPRKDTASLAELRGTRVAIGTDGLGHNLFAELQAAFWGARPADQRPIDLVGWLAQSARLGGELLGLPLGRLEVGAPADLVVLESPTLQPLTRENIGPTVLTQMSPAWVRHVMVDGDWRLRDGQPTGVDLDELRFEVAEVCEALWTRMATPHVAWAPLQASA